MQTGAIPNDSRRMMMTDNLNGILWRVCAVTVMKKESVAAPGFNQREIVTVKMAIVIAGNQNDIAMFA